MSHKQWLILELVKQVLSDPEFGKSLTHKIKELSLLMEDSMKSSAKLKKEVQTDSDPVREPGLNFEIVELGKNWLISGDSTDIPQVLIDAIVELSKTRQSVLGKTINIPGEKPLIVSFQRERTRIIGEIREDSFTESIENSVVNREFTRQEEQKILGVIDLMAMFPRFKEFLLSEVELKWRPIFESGAIEN